MPGLTGSPHHNYNRHLRAAAEATYGVVNPAPTWRELPILGDGFKLLQTAPRFRPETNWSGYDRSIAIHHSVVVAGAHTMLAWPQCVGYLMHAATDRDAVHEDLTSYTLDYYTSADPRRILGAVVESLAINVTGTGDSDVQFVPTWRARIEQQHDGLAETDYDYSDLDCIPFMFRDARIEINTVHSLDIEAFSLTLENALTIGPNRLGRVEYLVAGEQTCSLDLTRANLDQESRQAIRTGDTFSFEARFNHPLGHVFQLQLPVLGVEESDETASRTEISKEAPRLVCANCRGAGFTWGLDLAPTTTTLMPLTTTTMAPTTTTTPAP